ncbi:hypothetical protein MKK55_09525 [Methylobacterium sp. J-059]|uniref:hypothetical protein n=1 Tax=Methylobacterium sp. J-059 TaxID=2836643 RepID=UPI001FB8B657|nr:hypothetical protein [Methylobacterium sp. J-059]MCJ2039183.1 hypothetical protein [Methylobacterium sp. J-059]
MATIELFFKPETSSGVSSTDGVGVASHGFLIYRDDDGQVTGYARGGPEAARTSSLTGLGVFGDIVTDHGQYIDGTRDFDISVLHNPGFIVHSGTNDEIEAIKQKNYNTLDQIQDFGLKYGPFYSNSNSIVGTILKSDGFDVPQAALKSIYSAPAIDQDLLDQNFINNDRQTQDALRNLSDSPKTYDALSFEEGKAGGITAVRGDQVPVNQSDQKIAVVDDSTVSINGDRNSITLGINAGGGISGTGNTINLQADSNETIGITGQGLTVTGDAGNDVVNLNADTAATVSGGGYVGLCGDRASVTLTDPGSSVQMVGNAENESVSANNSTITLSDGSLVNINGTSNTINLQADSNETIGITGQGLTVTGDAGNDVVNLNADTAATVSGGGYVGLCGNGATLKTDADQAFTINTAPNVTNDTIYADNSTINLAPGWSGSIYGLGLTINMSPDSGSDVTVYGFDDQVTGSRGDTLQADAYDPNDTSDPYAPYEPGDPEPGTPFDPGDFDPFDPLDPYDDERVATTSTKSPPAAPSATAAHDIPSMQAGASATLASDAPSAIDSSSHIATQVSQLVSAMAAFGGSSAGITNLTTATSTANTTLTADPSQATHAFRHAA